MTKLPDRYGLAELSRSYAVTVTAAPLFQAFSRAFKPPSVSPKWRRPSKLMDTLRPTTPFSFQRLVPP